MYTDLNGDRVAMLADGEASVLRVHRPTVVRWIDAASVFVTAVTEPVYRVAPVTGQPATPTDRDLIEAALELHHDDNGYCSGCDGGYAYPCRTVRALIDQPVTP